jgi:hypothetical protein
MEREIVVEMKSDKGKARPDYGAIVYCYCSEQSKKKYPRI